ncbi:hypothetical protein CI238_05666 [Colletotrichum incanum]|uniref:Uncharacterized protein n=1 Tax=Colletotrichum incanum TaxID=1573173 RepID=A0A162P165_COLIC|nr:hypothetical protein CI238_05666 [Colletotrichum incanum]
MNRYIKPLHLVEKLGDLAEVASLETEVVDEDTIGPHIRGAAREFLQLGPKVWQFFADLCEHGKDLGNYPALKIVVLRQSGTFRVGALHVFVNPQRRLIFATSKKAGDDAVQDHRINHFSSFNHFLVGSPNTVGILLEPKEMDETDAMVPVESNLPCTHLLPQHLSQWKISRL